MKGKPVSSSGRVVIKDGKVVNGDYSTVADVYIDDGIVQQIGKDLMVPGGAKVIDAKNKYVFPGGVDAHTHFQVPHMGTVSIDDFYTGTKAAVAGGTTTILDIVIPQKGESLLQAFEKWQNWASDKVCCDYSLHVAVTWWSEGVKEDMEHLVNEKGVNSFQVFMAYKDVLQLSDSQIIEVFKTCKELGVLAMVHAENGDIVADLQKRMKSLGIFGPEGHLLSRPEEVESEAVHRALTMGHVQNCPVYILNITSQLAANVLANFKRQGSVVFGETTAAAVGANGQTYHDQDWKKAAGHVTSPPLRSDGTTAHQLLELLSSGGIDVLSSSHKTFNLNQKALGKDDFTKIPDGVCGAEERLALLWTLGVHSGIMSPCRFVEAVSAAPAKLFNLYPKKGRIAPGSDADIVIWDPSACNVISNSDQNHSVDFNVFEGIKVFGKAVHVMCGGVSVIENGYLRLSQGSGRYLHRKPNCSYYYDQINQRVKNLAPVPIKREGYKGSDAPAGRLPQPTASQEVPMQRGIRAGPDLHRSGFKLTGEQDDDNVPSRSSSKVLRPPGGGSSIFLR